VPFSFPLLCFFRFCFSCFSAFLLLCLSTSTFSVLQSCVFAALLPAPLLLCFLSLLSLSHTLNYSGSGMPVAQRIFLARSKVPTEV
jgi:hypothetical protein